MVALGFLSTYPPTPCGLASFTASLRAALPDGAVGGVVRVVDAVDTSWPSGVVGQLLPGSVASRRSAAGLLDRQDVVIIQHEYGIYGGADGDDVLGVLAMLSVPAVVVLHTVLTTPTPHQRFVLDAVVAAAAAVVVMTETARSRLIAGYHVDADRIAVIPHRAPDTDVDSVTPDRDDGGQILTWGLLGPGKGIEWGIGAMTLLNDMRPRPRYVVAGRTHPKVLAHQGERYRHTLKSRANVLVEHQNPAAIATAVRTILTDDTAAAGMSAAAATAARTLGWASVAKQYRGLAESLVRQPAPVAA